MTVDSTIRPADPKDAADVALSQILAWQLAYAGILPAEYLDAMDLDRLTTAWGRILTEPSPGVRRLVLCVDDRAVGWSGFGTPRDEADDGTGELQALNLHPGCWSQGLGSALFRESVAALTEMGYKRAYLWVAHGNERAARFYGRHGWTADGVTKNDARFTPALLEHRFSAVLL